MLEQASTVRTPRMVRNEYQWKSVYEVSAAER